MTSVDAREPGGSEYVERKEVTVHRFPDADASPPRGIGGSGAGSTVDLFFMGKPAPEEHDIVAAQRVIAELRTALEAARREIDLRERGRQQDIQELDETGRMLDQAITDLAQSRATEAELRAKVRDDGWTVYWDQTYWAAEHQSKRGLVAGSETWEGLILKMADAENAWDAAMAERTGRSR